MSVDEIGQLEGWSGGGSVAKLLFNEFELDVGAHYRAAFDPIRPTPATLGVDASDW